jgi:uncharacterized protein YjbI with pentapeptide repeats
MTDFTKEFIAEARESITEPGAGMNTDELKTILEQHKLWLEDEGGARANLQYADLQGADLRGADLQGADLDYSCLPLWCGSKGMIVDKRIASQIAAHFCVLECDDAGYLAARTAILEFARSSHRAEDLGLLEEVQE